MDTESEHWNCRKLYLLQIFRIFCLLVWWLVGCWKCCSSTQNRPRPVDSEHSAIFQCMYLPFCRGRCEWRDHFQQGKVAKRKCLKIKGLRYCEWSFSTGIFQCPIWFRWVTARFMANKAFRFADRDIRQAPFGMWGGVYGFFRSLQWGFQWCL